MPERADRERIDAVVDRLLARSEEAEASRHAEVWRRFLRLTDDSTWHDAAPDEQAAWANLVGLTIHKEAEDFLSLNSLIHALGHEPLAVRQDRLDALLGYEDDQPVLSTALRVLSSDHLMRESLIAAGIEPRDATDMAELNYHHTSWLILVGITPQTPHQLPESRDQLARVIETGTVDEWRAFVAPIAAQPWGPVADRLITLAEDAHEKVVVRTLEEFRLVYRVRQEQREKEYVAREIRRLVALSGLTQRDFAAYVGTSASRLSTYVSGKVTPSAAMLLRIRRAATTLRQRND